MTGNSRRFDEDLSRWELMNLLPSLLFFSSSQLAQNKMSQELINSTEIEAMGLEPTTLDIICQFSTSELCLLLY